MAGGAAVLTGGGALMGLAGSGATAVSVVAQSSGAFVQNECAKLLAFCEEIALKKCGRADIVALAQKGMSNCTIELKSEIEKLSNVKDKTDRKLISQMKKSLKCMERCEKALLKLVEKSSS